MTIERGSSRRRFRLQLSGTLLACSAVLAVATAGGSPSAGVTAARVPAVLTAYLTAVGKAPLVPPTDRPLGAAKLTAPLDLDVVLQPRDPAALSSFATAVSTPGNPLYRHFLPKGMFASVFGPTPATITAVTAYLREVGLSPGPISADHLSIPVTTSVGVVEKALHISMRLYRQPGSVPATAVANSDSPELPTSIAKAVQGILGLDTVSAPVARPIAARPHPGAASTPTVATANAPKACAAAVATANKFGGWTETQLAKAYSFDPVFAKGDLGAGVTIALFEEQTYSAASIKTYQSCYGTHVPITNVSVDGGNKDADFSPEAALDIETVIGLAPKAALRVYETSGNGNGPTDGYRSIVTQDKAQVISSSWSSAPLGCDLFVPQSQINAENTIFQEAATQGQSTFVADGDVGSEGCMGNGGPREFDVGTSPSTIEGSDVIAVDPNNHTVYVGNFTSGTITVVSELTLNMTTISLGAAAGPDGLAVDPTTGELWISEDKAGIVAEVDAATCNGNTHSAAGCKVNGVAHGTGSEPAGIAVNSVTGTVYVALSGTGAIFTGQGAIGVFNEKTVALLGTFQGGDEPEGVAVNPKTNTVWFTDFGGAGFLDVFSGASCDAASTTGCPTSPFGEALGIEPDGVAVDPTTNRLYVTNVGSDTLSVLTASTGTIVATTHLAGQLEPTSVALDPNAGAVIVTAFQSDSIVIVSTKTNAVTRIMTQQGNHPISVATDSSLGYSWAADTGLGTKAAPGGLVWLPLLLSVEDPSGQPFVTGVGGTDLTKLGPKPTESVWDEPLLDEGAGTGGISSRFTMPSYQHGPGVVSSFSSRFPCDAKPGKLCRELPDVSASADPSHGYVIFDGGSWTVVGGTSAATPLWAALTALLDVYKGKVHKLGFLNPALYKLVAAGKPILNDVTVGTNDYTTTNGGSFPATKHYDMATGLGTPIVSALAKALG